MAINSVVKIEMVQLYVLVIANIVAISVSMLNQMMDLLAECYL